MKKRKCYENGNVLNNDIQASWYRTLPAALRKSHLGHCLTPRHHKFYPQGFAARTGIHSNRLVPCRGYKVDALCSRLPGYGCANEVAKGWINRLVTITKKSFALGDPISSSTTCVMYAIIATTDKRVIIYFLLAIYVTVLRKPYSTAVHPVLKSSKACIFSLALDCLNWFQNRAKFRGIFAF